MISDSIRAVILGIVEGVTEFIPVSSTGHLLLAERFFDLGEGEFWKSFAVLIQLAPFSPLSRSTSANCGDRARHVLQPRGPALRHRRAGGVSARGGDRGGRRRLHKELSVQSWVVCFR